MTNGNGTGPAPDVRTTASPAGDVSTETPAGVLLAVFEFPLLNAGLREVIGREPDLEVVGEVSDREALFAELERLAPTVVILEALPVNSHGRTTLETIEAIRRTAPGVHVLGWACRASSEQFSLALKAGADGFLTREAAGSDVVTALRCIGRGQTYVSPAIVTRMVNTYLLKSPDCCMDDPYDNLSDREQEVLLLAAVGHTNREIANTLHLSEQTVHNYRAGLMEKLGFHDRVELLKYAVRRGVINVADL